MDNRIVEKSQDILRVMKAKRISVAKYGLAMFVSFLGIVLGWLLYFPKINVLWNLLIFAPCFFYFQNRIEKVFRCPKCSGKLYDAEGFYIFLKECPSCKVHLR